MGKHVVGYLSWEDFLREVEAARPRTVRVQTYHRAEGKRPPFSIRFWAEAAFVSRDEIHVARLPLGSIPGFLLDDPAERERFAALMEQAEAAIRAALAPYGVEARRGIYAGTDKLRITTSPVGLWRWEKDGNGHPVLVPELPQEAPA
ncbi:hypothetical protein [Thermoflexus sp.]|uniref:hypothetical protein n=1 Tax=Thermoflexus sp. TaxID=1969742 RepID=UPI002ADE02F2|nr:hypothetical protein [Thermoflexus sp.]